MIFADARYNRRDKRNKLPKWIKQFLLDGYLNLSTDVAITHVQTFLREMSQPINQEKLQRVFFSAEELLEMEQQLAQSRAIVEEVGLGGHIAGGTGEEGLGGRAKKEEDGDDG